MKTDNQFWKVIVINNETGEREEFNRVTNVKEFKKQYPFDEYYFEVSKLSELEFIHTEQ